MCFHYVRTRRSPMDGVQHDTYPSSDNRQALCQLGERCINEEWPTSYVHDFQVPMLRSSSTLSEVVLDSDGTFNRTCRAMKAATLTWSNNALSKNSPSEHVPPSASYLA